VVKDEQVAIGVVATPAAAAQEVCDRLVAAGVNSILNFAPAHLQVPEGVFLRKVDLSTELQILSFHEQRRAAVNLVRQTAAASGRGGAGQRARSPEGPQARG
jgi:redox-sensing transcriptional repressor